VGRSTPTHGSLSRGLLTPSDPIKHLRELQPRAARITNPSLTFLRRCLRSGSSPSVRTTREAKVMDWVGCVDGCGWVYWYVSSLGFLSVESLFYPTPNPTPTQLRQRGGGRWLSHYAYPHWFIQCQGPHSGTTFVRSEERNVKFQSSSDASVV
jgi:hypothetical protein